MNKMLERNVSSENPISVNNIKRLHSLPAPEEENKFEDPKEEKPATVNTFVKKLIMPYKISSQTVVNGQEVMILTFAGGLTLLMASNDPNPPNMEGVAELDVHRKLLPAYGKYLHWICFSFPDRGVIVRAQLMLPSRLQAALVMVTSGAAAAFVQSPFRMQRRSRVMKKREGRNGRTKLI
jgi:hypothetical protein